MRSTAGRVLVAVGAVAVIVVLFIVLSGGDDGDDEPAPVTTPPAQDGETRAEREAQRREERRRERARRARARGPVIVVSNAQPRGEVRELTFERGDRIRFVVRSDVADEVHVHGYDLSKNVKAGGSVRFDFRATIEGVFEIELEQRHVQIASLSVTPS
jgi:hypothetical protein